jgi:hypothetical protein
MNYGNYLLEIELPQDAQELLVEYTYTMFRYVKDLKTVEDSDIVHWLDKLKNYLQRLDERARADLVSTAAEEVFGASELKSKILGVLLPPVSADGIASAVQALDNLIRYIDGTPYFAGEYSLTQLVYRDLTPDYLCYVVEIEGQKAILEVIRDSLLGSGGFPNFQAWESYLDSLSNQMVISLIDVTQLSNGNSFAVYRIPDGYRLIESWFGFSGSPFRNLKEYFDVILGINQAVEKTKRGSFFFTNVHSKFIACSGERHVKLSAIGSALLATSRFLSAHSNKPSLQDELGFPAYSKFLGWLLFEMASDKCPIEETAHLQRNPQLKYLSNSPLIDTHPSHLRAFLKRATHRDEDFRYTDFAPISEDASHIIDFLVLQNSPEMNNLSRIDQLLLELVDYTCLRLKAS